MKKKFNFIDMTGWVMKEHGVPNSRLTVVELVDPYISPSDGHKRQQWKCKCECGKEFITLGNRIRAGKVLSCGCYHLDLSREIVKLAADANRTHGESTGRLYKIWAAMKVRCHLVTDPHYPDYGGRGIVVCDEWTNSYEAFRDWALANGYNDRLTIDRINVDGNYEPSNCRWSTIKEQSNNKRGNFYITYNGETKTSAQWSEITGISAATIRDRIRKFGYTVEEALTLPVGCFRNGKKQRRKILSRVQLTL